MVWDLQRPGFHQAVAGTGEVKVKDLNYRLTTPDGYLIPRKDGLVLGGNALKGSWDTTPSREQTEKVVAAINEVMDHMRG